MGDELKGSKRPLRHGYAQVGRVRLHYVERGEGEPLVLLLHGFPECWYSWRYQLLALGERYRVVAPDLRGYNLSDKPKGLGEYRLDALVEDVVGLIRHFGVERAGLVGHDWGAAIAWAVAQSCPEAVWRLAALQVPPLAVWLKNMNWAQALSSWYAFFFQLPYLPELLIGAGDFALLESLFKRTARRGTFTDEDIACYKLALRQANGLSALTAALNYYRANRAILWASLVALLRGVKTTAGRVRVPTLFIYGERDFAILPQTVAGVRDLIDAPYMEVRLPTTGHWVQQESPIEVNDALLRFLEMSF